MRPMYLYLLSLREEWDDEMPSWTDYTQRVVIRAHSPRAARILADAKLHNSDLHKYIGQAWLNTSQSKIVNIGECTPGTNTTPGVIVSEGVSHG